MTLMAEKLRSAGVDTDAALLNTIAVDLLRKHGGSFRDAVIPFVQEVRDAGGIMAALVSYETTRNVAYLYLEARAADMAGKNLKVPAKAGDGVQSMTESRWRTGLVENSEGDGSVNDMPSQVMFGSSPSETVPSRDGGGVHSIIESQNATGSPEQSEGEAVQFRTSDHALSGPSPSLPIRNDAVHRTNDSQGLFGRAVPIPNKPRGLEVMRRANAATPSIFDTVMVRGIGPVGDVVWSTIPRLIKERACWATISAQEAALLFLIHRYGRPAMPDARVRDVLKEDALMKMVEQSKFIATREPIVSAEEIDYAQ